jgi:hypothetical protein
MANGLGCPKGPLGPGKTSLTERGMAKATAHPDHQLVSSEDVQGTEVYGVGDEVVGEIDHL